VNLDGRGEKFVPGACLSCHGGDKYAGTASGLPDVGGHFLPYDSGNFAFSTDASYTDAKQEPGIYQLNQNVLGTLPTPATWNLIDQWYANSRVLNQQYVPPPWENYTSPFGLTTAQNIQMYQSVVARSCRTCHAAQPNFNWDADPAGLISALSFVCGGSPNRFLNHTMPNSAVTYDRFWLSAGSTTTPDQRALFAQFLGKPASACPFADALMP
jgi:mono/diheme cytochrome c family protein